MALVIFMNHTTLFVIINFPFVIRNQKILIFLLIHPTIINVLIYFLNRM